MILVACGVVAEARAAASSEVVAVPGGGDASWLAAELDRRAPQAEGIVSWGLAGALHDDLRVGDWVVGSGVTGGFEFACDAEWQETAAAALPGAHRGRVHADGVLADPARKRALAVGGAVVVDMESHVAARVAAAYGLPFLILRVVSDRVDDILPPAAVAAMGRRGTTDYRCLLAALARHPVQLPAFAAFAWRSVGALGRLKAGGVRLGPRLGAAAGGRG